MKKSTILFSCLLGLSLLNSCKKDEDENTTPTASEPKAGSTWVLRMTDLNEDGSIESTMDFHLLASDTSIQGSNWLKLTRTEDQAVVSYFQKRSDGWWKINPGTSTPTLWIKDPAVVGESYTTLVTDGSVDTMKVVAVDQSITVAAGTISNCLKIENYDTNSLEGVNYFNSNQGIFIYQEEYDEHTNGNPGMFTDYKMELVSFNP
ncbi:MAG: hypothetical protein K1X82_00780 [Bacteroidia bacterium]|nr:hypothetical protein [Bacteroidia bacterium]